MTNLMYLGAHTITWAAERLVETHGEKAALLARSQAGKLNEEGQEELAMAWEMVETAASQMTGNCHAKAAHVVH